MNKFISSTILSVLLLCSHAVHADVYTDAVANPARSDKDREVDERRKPAEVMRFFEIKPGMAVFDVFAGGGYYSELMSSVVGLQGSVTLYNNAPWDSYVDKAVTERLKDHRLPLVERMVATPESLLTLDRKYDAAIFILGMHDVYYANVEDNWPAIDKQKFLQGIFFLLKAGAVFGVIDANAEAGADNETVGKEIHRVDPQALIDDITAVGFKLEASSDILRNSDDDKTSSVFLPANRYNTDRSVLRFRKP